MEQQSIAGLDGETLDFTLESISEFARRELPDSLLIELDERDEFPEELVRRMCDEELGVQLLFIPEEFGGRGGGAVDVYRVCERMATIDRGVATSVLATFTGRARLSQAPLPAPPEGDSPSADAREGGELDRDAVYRVYFHGPAVDAEVVDESGKVRVRLEGYMTTALPGGLDPEALDPIRAAMG